MEILLLMTWQETEAEVRQIAEWHWSATCRPETYAGVKFDGIIRLSQDHWILIEISESNTISKIREDISKFYQAKFRLFDEGIFAECYFITSNTSDSSARTSAADNKVKYFTVEEFRSKFFGIDKYIYGRKDEPFGSAVNIGTSKKDSTRFIETRYFESPSSPGGTNNIWDIEKICEGLNSGKHIVLLGEFGTGKSRCLMETWNRMTEADVFKSPVAIDLRFAWGKSWRETIIEEHLISLGLSEIRDSLIKSLNQGNTPILLDGFDELGSQSWSTDIEKMKEVRATATKGVKDLIKKSSKCGVLITGREHYFSSDQEMLNDLGLDENAIILKCPDEFTYEQAQDYLADISESAEIPEWLPLKPLLCQLVGSLPPEELRDITQSATGEIEFFERSLDAICKRENKTAVTIDPYQLQQLLISLALRVKKKPEGKSSLSQEEIAEEFQRVVGESVGPDSMALIQKLPYLGRFSPDSQDRTFIDDYVLQGLMGLGLCKVVTREIQVPMTTDWRRPLCDLGLSILSTRITFNAGLAFANSEMKSDRFQFAADFVAATLFGEETDIDFGNLFISGAEFSHLNLASKVIRNLTIIDPTIHRLQLEGPVLQGVSIRDSNIGRIEGVSSENDVPKAFEGFTFEEISKGFNSSRIAELDISNSQKTLISIIQKLYFQPGRGRKESALTRGTDDFWDADSAKEVIKYLLAQKLVSRIKSSGGYIYIPNRSYTDRMNNIRAKRSGSGDELWDLVS